MLGRDFNDQDPASVFTNATTSHLINQWQQMTNQK